MKVELKPVVDYYELEKAIQSHYGLDDSFNLAEICFPMAEFETYQSIEFGDDAIENVSHTVGMRLILNYLRIAFLPLHDEILVHYYW